MLRLRELLVAGDGVRLRVEEQADAQVQLPHRLHVRQPAPACPCARPRVVRRASRASSATSEAERSPAAIAANAARETAAASAAAADGRAGSEAGRALRRALRSRPGFRSARGRLVLRACGASGAVVWIVLCSGLHGAHALHGEGLHDEGFEGDVRGAPLGGAVGAAGSEVSPLSRPRRSSALSIPVSSTCVQPFIFGIKCRYQCGEDSVASSKHPEILREKKQELGDMSLCVVAEPYHRMTIPVTFLVMI